MSAAQAPSPLTPAAAWQLLATGNVRFVAGTPRHPHQSQWRRRDISAGQHPFAAILSCSDSRVPPEIVFDRGLGDLFTVRTAGHVLDDTVIGTIEYGVQHCHTPVLAVLGHESCGAVAATLAAVESGAHPEGHIGHLVSGVAPSVEACVEIGATCVGEVMEEHVRQTVRGLLHRSPVVAQAVAEGRLAVVGLTYRLSDGAVDLLDWIGDIGRAGALTQQEVAAHGATLTAQQEAADAAVAAAGAAAEEAMATTMTDSHASTSDDELASLVQHVHDMTDMNDAHEGDHGLGHEHEYGHAHDDRREPALAD